MSDPFASASELSELIGQDMPADLARMQLFLSLASAEVRRHTGQTLSVVTGDVVVLLPEPERTTLILPQRPVTAITSVVANGVTLSASTDYYFTRSGLLHSGTMAVAGTYWTYGATVTYTHGYAETTDEYQAIKKIVLEAASNGYTMNERSQSEVLGGLGGGTVLESAGYAPAVFLTPAHMRDLADFGKVYVG